MATPIVTALLPSRGRPDSLTASIHSLRKKAARSDRVEIIVGADPDDANTAITALGLAVPCWIAPRRYGYSRLNEYFNKLAEYAKGDWLLLWNDDARMETEGWDRRLGALTDAHLHPGGEKVHVADLWVDGHSPDLCTFPAISRAIYEAAGGYSPHTCHCDTWWQDIGRALGVIRPVPIRVDHQRADLTGKHNDTTYQEGLAGYRSAEFYGQEVQGHMRDTIEQIRGILL